MAKLAPCERFKLISIAKKHDIPYKGSAYSDILLGLADRELTEKEVEDIKEVSENLDIDIERWLG